MNRERTLKCFQHRRTQTFHIRDVLEYDGELVATEPRCEASGKHRTLAQTLTYGLNHSITEFMTQAVVDRLEVVEIDEQQRDSITSHARSCDDRLQMIKETAPVRQLRQWIVIRKMPQFASAFGHARLELYLLTAHIGLGLLQLFSHVIER